MTMSDRICLMNAGKIEQLGTPDDLYFRPRTLFVADFLGESNLLPAQVTEAGADRLGVRFAEGAPPAETRGNGSAFATGQKVKVMVRPQNLTVAPQETGGKLVGRVSDVMVSGSLTKLYMESVTPGLPPLVAAYPTRAGSDHHEIGQLVALDWHPTDAVAIMDEAA